jgi:hypothetical protein
MRRTIRYALLLCAAGLFAATGATAGSLITGAKVKNGSLTGKDVKDRSLTAKDFKAGSLPAGRDGANGRSGDNGLAGTNGASGANGSAGLPGAPGPNGSTGPAGTSGLTMKVLSLPDSVRAPEPTAISEERATIPDDEFHAIGSVGGYSLRMACLDTLRFYPDTGDYKYASRMEVRIAGDNLANSSAGFGSSYQYDFPGPPPQTTIWNTDTEGQASSDNFSLTTGDAVKVFARIVTDENSCQYRNVKLYVWS